MTDTYAPEEIAEWQRYHVALSEHSALIRQALYVYLERMEGAALGAEAEYKRGQEDPEVKAQQDASLMTNRGYRISAQMFRESADSARKALDDIMNAELGPEGDEFGEG
ncbi:hypothetical protein [Streptomyces pseudogriseolus]|uniref:hypothetical protein n=1 Tax=Streptomyces pseudogriseolus TaxID=36817 RepID=UPI003FA1B5BE